jgi:hypothetical protein
MGTGLFSKETKQLGHEPDYSAPSTAEIKNVSSYTSTPPYIFMTKCSIKHGATLSLHFVVRILKCSLMLIFNVYFGEITYNARKHQQIIFRNAAIRTNIYIASMKPLCYHFTALLLKSSIANFHYFSDYKRIYFLRA